MHMFETFDSSWQRTAEHQDRLLRSAGWRQGRHHDDSWWGRRSTLRHPAAARRSE